MVFGHNNNNNWSGVALTISLVVLLLSVMVMLGGCRTIPEPIVIKDTREVYRDIHTYDSIWIHDSVYVRVTPDTVFMEKWHTKYVDKLKVDSFIRIDSIPVPYGVIKEVKIEKELSNMMRVKMAIGKWVLIFFGMLSVGLLLKKLFRF